MRVLLYGIDGAGVTSLATAVPGAYLIRADYGAEAQAVAGSARVGTYRELLQALREVPPDAGAIVLDTLDAVEWLIWLDVCDRYRADCIERVDGGYGRGYVYALHAWHCVVEVLDELHAARMHVVLTAHSTRVRVEDPEIGPHDQYVPRVHRLALGLLVSWADVVGFVGYRRIPCATDCPYSSTPVRIIRTVTTPTAMAKNRVGLPPVISADWRELFNACDGTTGSADIFDHERAGTLGGPRAARTRTAHDRAAGDSAADRS